MAVLYQNLLLNLMVLYCHKKTVHNSITILKTCVVLPLKFNLTIDIVPKSDSTVVVVVLVLLSSTLMPLLLPVSSCLTE